jgi:hypothetical protein
MYAPERCHLLLLHLMPDITRHLTRPTFFSLQLFHHHDDFVDIPWVFNAFLPEDYLKPCVFSTFPLIQQPPMIHPRLQMKMYSNLVLGIALNHCGLEYCENSYCTLNNVDSAVEAAMKSSLILCPACIRKLQGCHVLGHSNQDVSCFLSRLKGTLSQNSPIRSICKRELKRLDEYGAIL